MLPISSILRRLPQRHLGYCDVCPQQLSIAILLEGMHLR
jgi:hypothetical protein